MVQTDTSGFRKELWLVTYIISWSQDNSIFILCSFEMCVAVASAVHQMCSSVIHIYTDECFRKGRKSILHLDGPQSLCSLTSMWNHVLVWKSFGAPWPSYANEVFPNCHITLWNVPVTPKASRLSSQSFRTLTNLHKSHTSPATYKNSKLNHNITVFVSDGNREWDWLIGWLVRSKWFVSDATNNILMLFTKHLHELNRTKIYINIGK